MKALVVGAGKMGIPIAYAFNKLGFQVTQVDLSTASLDQAAAQYKSLGVSVRLTTQSELYIYRSVDFDICLSAAPYTANYTWAEWCKDRRVPFCDLGGNQASSNAIHELSHNLNPDVPVFTDLGLAPGLLNILGEAVYQEQAARGNVVHKVAMRCGGLPVFRHQYSPLQYSIVFSVQGLRNEYSGNCQVLRNGDPMAEPALTGLEDLTTRRGGKFEAFNTSGGISTSFQDMFDRGVQELDYKTIRYPGHCKQVELMRDTMDSYTFIDTMKRLCPPTHEDWVLIQAWATSLDPNLVIKKEIEVFYDENWSAMQQATAFPAVAVASLVAEKRWKKPVLAYSDVPFAEFTDRLNQLGFADISKSFTNSWYETFRAFLRKII